MVKPSRGRMLVGGERCPS